MAILRSEDFLITTWVGEVSRKVMWDGEGSHDLDLPLSWVIERHDDKFRIRNASIKSAADQMADAIEFQVPAKGYRTLVELPPSKKGDLQRPLDIEIIHMKPLDPVYLLRHTMAPNYTGHGPKQLMQFYGESYYLVRYRPVPAARAVYLQSFGVFAYEKTARGYFIAARTPGLKIKTATGKHNVPMGTRIEMTEQAFFSATFILGVHWWRFRYVPTPDAMPAIETEETEDDVREELRFKQSALMFLVTFMVLLGSMYKQSLDIKPPPKIIAAVEIKQPKIIPPTKEELKPKPPPPAPPEPPKVVEAKPEPPPKPEPPAKKPEPKVAKKTPKPKTIAKIKPPPKAELPPPPVSPEPPPPVKEAKVEPPPDNGAAQKAAETAAMKQQLLSKLNFLSTSNKRAAADPKEYDKKEGKFSDAAALGADVAKSSKLDKMAKGAPSDGTIKTNSSRTVASNVDFGAQKGLNDVQGKVSLSEVQTGGGKIGEGMTGSLSVTGEGQVSDAAIEKALSKYLQRFQFCYEKALLSDSSLGGKMEVQWTINGKGKGQDPKVTTSQLNNTDLHNCIGKVIKEIPFPKPTGGTVIVKKKFAFSSSTL